jgi:hypothetical protein
MSHHSSDWDDDTRKAMSEMMQQVFGEFPNGKLNTEDEGALACAVGHEKGVVKLLFPKPVAWIGFTPEQAIDLAQDLIKHARQCGFAGVYTLQIGKL